MHSKRVTRRAPPRRSPSPVAPLRRATTANCTRLYPRRFWRIPLSREKYLMFGKNRMTTGARFVIGANPFPRTGRSAPLPPPASLPLGFFVDALRSAPVSVFGTFLLCMCGSFAEKCAFFSTTQYHASRPSRASSRKRSAEITLIIFDEIV